MLITTRQTAATGPADSSETNVDKGLAIESYVPAAAPGVGLRVADRSIMTTNTDLYLWLADAVGRLDIADDHREPASPAPKRA